MDAVVASPTSGHNRALLVDLEGHGHATDHNKKSCRASRLTDILCLQSVAAEPTSVAIRVSRD